ncbi:MAG: InlB B-repeat-containing protein [Chitinispirillaceae bacterium]|nr:InlB B-repeat-containing protein [Chitinispirillaceae bacterium]
MKRGMLGFTISLFVVSSIVLFRCGLSDPTDPSKTSMNAVFKNAESEVFGTSIVDTVGKPLRIGAALYLPANFDSISLVIKENAIVTFDTMFKIFNDDYFYDTAWCTRIFTSEGIKKVTLTPFSNPVLPEVTTNVPIFERPVVTTVHITFLSNAPSATGSMPVQAYISGTTVALPENAFVNSGYRFSGWATSATGSIQYRDKEEVTIGTEDLLLYAVWVDPGSIAPAIVYAPSQLISGKADTLLFAVDNGSRPDSLTISLLTEPPLDPAIFSIVPSGADSIRIAIAKSAGPTTATIGIVTSNGNKSDTAKYTITLISPDTALWNTTYVDKNAVEGLPFELDLSQYLSAINGSTGVSLSADIGSIDQTTWSYTPKWGSAATIPAIITATKGELSLALTINLTIAKGDTAKPQISLVDPSLDGKKVSSEQVTVECKATDAGAGIDSVIFTCGTKEVTGTLQGEDVYSGVITGLVHNTPTQITITATDKSRMRNSATLTFSVTRDSTILDAEPPVIVKTSGPESGSRVKGATGGLTFTVNDNSGVDSVWWTLNDVFVAAVASSGGNYYSVNYTLTGFGKNSIKLFAKDKSDAGNEGSQTITLTYNTEMSAVTLIAPAANTTGVSISPIFKWSGGDDADGDGVTYTVNYGISQESLTGTAAVTGKTATPGTLLAYAKTYYWQVTATSASTVYPDKVQSAVGTFTTEGSLPTISAHPLSKSVEEGQSVTFSVTAGGFGTLSYQWRLNGSVIEGATSASYTISSVTTSMDNNNYDCVVKNEVDSVTSTSATLTVTAIPTFKVLFVTDGGTPKPDSQMVKRGGLVIKPVADPLRSGYRFTGWYELNAASVFSFTSKTITANLTIYAGWKKVYTLTYHKNAGEDGDVPADPAVYDSGTTVTLAGNTGNLKKTGYRFLGWTTTSNGSGNAITTISVNADIHLYPKWEQTTFTITYDKSGGTGTVPTDPNNYTSGSTAIILPNSGALVNSSSSFAGWSTINGTTYGCGQKITIIDNLTLYAKYSATEVMDNDGNLYTSVLINGTRWLAQNLKTTKYRDGSSVDQVAQGDAWLSHTAGAYCWCRGTIADSAYGAIYNWAAAQAGQLAPAGWRIATDAEWTALFEENDLCYLRTADPQYWLHDGCSSYSMYSFNGFNAMGIPALTQDGKNNVELPYTFTDWWVTGGKQATLQFSMSTFGRVASGVLPGCYIRCVKD